MLSFSQLVTTLLLCFASLSLGLYILYRFNNLFKSFISNEWLRINIVSLLMFESFFCTIIPIFHDFQFMASQKGLTYTFFVFCFFVMLNVLPTVNIILALKSLSYFKRKTFTQQQVLVILVILVVPTLATIGLNFYNNHLTTKYFKWAITYSLFSGSLVSIGYLFYTYASYEKKQVIQARELEYSRLNELKTKAELEALHAKINPHFLYNALNSIADLTITDGRKAREMTVALSELFRYTINYSNSNFSTIKEEIEMAETYLRIEKIRFEENLTYKIHVADDALYAKIPKFILQPIIENAVKHGLSALEKNGEVKIDVSLQNEDLVIKVYDNGRKFKSDFSAGFGYKNIIEKLKILHPGGYQLEFINNPDKHVMLILNTISKPLQND